MNGPFKSTLFWQSIMIAAATVALAIGAQFYAAHEADRSSLLRDQTLVENGMVSRVAELGRRAISIASWDEAVANLDNTFDLEWAKANVGRYFAETEGFEAAMVLDRDDQPIYAMQDGETVEVDAAASLREGAAPLVARVRGAEHAGARHSAAVAAEKLSDAIFFSAITRVGGELFVLSAMLVQPDFGRAIPRTDRSAVLITGEAINAEFIEVFVNRFQLADARLIDGVSQRSPGHAQIGLRGGDDKVVATLEWTPPALGAGLLRKSLPATLLIILCLGAVAWHLYQKGLRATQNLIASEARASHLASHDVLTGLGNRALLSDRLGHAIDHLRRTGEAFAVHFVDLDRFKEINDTFGHETGDDLLRAAAKLLCATRRPADMLARLGGDEFAIIQHAACPVSAAAFAEQLVSALCLPIDLPIGSVTIGCSIGVTLVENAQIDPPECLRQADLALYRAKESGRGRIAFFEPDMDAAVRLRRSLQSDLRRALDSDEIWLAYQPQVNGSGRIVGVEALVRWNHPERGQIAPGVFVPLAEESGLIEALGMKVLRHAFADSARFDDIKVAVNVSAAQLRMTTFVPQLLELLAETGVNPRRFELEITEGLLLGDDGLTHQSLRRLRATGFGIALDDFGTGYSSLGYLQRYPIDKIKIDRSFITNLGLEDTAEAVVSAIVTLTRALGLAVIAEGVETEKQLARLTAIGCSDFQGFLFGKAVAAEHIEVMIAARRSEQRSNRPTPVSSAAPQNM